MNMSNDYYYNDCKTDQEACIDYIISLSVVSSMFIVSEILPFLRGQNNGIADCLLKCFQGSDCILSKLIECLKNKKDDEDDGNIEVNTKLTSQQENQMKNSININIGETKIEKS